MLDVNLMGVGPRRAGGARPAWSSAASAASSPIASTAGLKGYPYVTAYCAAKHAVVGLVRVARARDRARPASPSTPSARASPTPISSARASTRIVAKTGRSREEALAELVRHNPQGRLIEPREVADAVLWLCGDGARSVTGQAIAVAGGEV